MTSLALFDFDGTITTKDTFTAFLHFALSPRRLLAGKLLLAPLVIGYKAGRVQGGTIRTAVSRFGFMGTGEDTVRAAGARFAAEFLPTVMRPSMLERIQWHRDRGDRIVVVSASLDVYLAPWCQAQGLELICTELEFRDGRASGRYLRGDCSGERKAVRIREACNLDAYDEVHAYGDTREDLPMLAAAHHKYYRGRKVETNELMGELDHHPHQA